eukprot:COSAG06_NODE_573_length_14086_cov_30.835633_3_plen_149_part_00
MVVPMVVPMLGLLPLMLLSTAPRSVQQCSTVNGWTFSKGSRKLPRAHDPSTSTAEACCKWCHDTPGCCTWTLNSGSVGRGCWLHGARPAGVLATRCHQCTSGSNSTNPLPPSPPFGPPSPPSPPAPSPAPPARHSVHSCCHVNLECIA